MATKRNRNKADVQSKAKNENSVLFTKERIAKAKKLILETVEMLLEEDISNEQLTSACKILSQSDFMDVIEERNILHLCGYPVCSNTLEMLNKKYHISTKVNKVYDITERKCFCSNICFKASKYLQSQLSESSIWMRKEEKAVEIKLLPAASNRGSAGDEIDLGFIKITKDEIVKDKSSEGAKAAHDTREILMKELETCAAQFKELEIKERKSIFEKQPDFEDSQKELEKDLKIATEAIEDYCVDYINDSECIGDIVEMEDDDEILFPPYDNKDNLNEKYMPVPSNSPSAHSVLLSLADLNPVVTAPCLQNPAQFEFVQKNLKEWITEDTLKFLFGDEYVENIKKELLKTSVRIALQTRGAQHYEDEYVKLCQKLDRLEMKEINEDSIINRENCHYIEQDGKDDEFSSLSVEDKIASFFKSNIADLNPKTNPIRKKPKKCKKNSANQLQVTKQAVIGGSEVMQQSKDIEKDARLSLSNAENQVENHQGVRPLPLVDSLAQNTLRRQVVVDRLKHVYQDLLPLIGRYYRDIRDHIMQLVATFRLTSTNVVLQPLQWKLVAIILLRMLKFKSSDVIPDDSFNLLLEKVQLKTELTNTVIDLDDLVSDVTSYKDLCHS